MSDVRTLQRIMPSFTESIVEDAALAWLAGLNYAIAHGPNLAPDQSESALRTWLHGIISLG